MFSIIIFFIFSLKFQYCNIKFFFIILFFTAINYFYTYLFYVCCLYAHLKIVQKYFSIIIHNNYHRKFHIKNPNNILSFFYLFLLIYAYFLHILCIFLPLFYIFMIFVWQFFYWHKFSVLLILRYEVNKKSVSYTAVNYKIFFIFKV